MNTAFEILVYLVAALLPAVLLLVFIYKNDRIEKEDLSLLWRLVGLGIAAAVFAAGLEFIFSTFVLDTIRISSFVLQAFADAFMVGLVEEGCKFYFLKKSTFNNYNFDYVFDGIVYAVFIGLGFAAIENVLYVFEYGLSVAVLRGLLAVPAHMAFGVYMGSFYSYAKHYDVYGKTVPCNWNLFLAYAIPVLFHTIYDACLSTESDFFFWLFIVFLSAMDIIAFILMKRTSRKDHSVY